MIPGFTAARALEVQAKARAGDFRTAGSPDGVVRPQRIPSPEGPIGLPGQNACEVCWHMCMSFGFGGYRRCAQVCAATCAASGSFGMLQSF